MKSQSTKTTTQDDKISFKIVMNEAEYNELLRRKKELLAGK